VWAAERTGGLVDPTLADALAVAGYASSRAGATPAPLAAALRWAPARRPARPDPAARWRAVEVDRAAGVVRRPPGLALDTGGTGKGLAADAVAYRLRETWRFLVDCGGDLAIGGAGSAERPWDVDVIHPLTGERAHVLRCRAGGVATSGLDVRLWRRDDGAFAHHLLDPSTREPAWTGLVGATALGASALEAEVLAKAALLSGPRDARRVLREHGGLIVHDDGDVELVGPVRTHVTVRLPAPLRRGVAA
jgi:thiamine biosynthesis lipoprotein